MTPNCLTGRRPQYIYLEDDYKLFTWKTTPNSLPGIRPQTVYLEDNPKLSSWKMTTNCLSGIRPQTVYLEDDPKLFSWKMTTNCLPGRWPQTVYLKYDPKLFTLKTTSNSYLEDDPKLPSTEFILPEVAGVILLYRLQLYTIRIHRPMSKQIFRFKQLSTLIQKTLHSIRYIVVLFKLNFEQKQWTFQVVYIFISGSLYIYFR